MSHSTPAEPVAGHRWPLSGPKTRSIVFASLAASEAVLLPRAVAAPATRPGSTTRPGEVGMELTPVSSTTDTVAGFERTRS